MALETIGTQAGANRQCDRGQQQYDHPGTGRIVSLEVLDRATAQAAQIGQRGAGWCDEFSEARVASADETPHHPRHDQCADEIADIKMPIRILFARQVGEGEGHHQGPVKHTYEAIPDINTMAHHVTPVW